MMRRDYVKLGLGIWTAVVLVFLFSPLVIVALFSFNDSTISRFPLSGFTLAWYRKLFSNAALHEALWNSLIIAFATVVVASSLGILAAVGIHRYGGRAAGSLRAFALTPMMVPRLIVGIALLTFYNLLQADLSLLTVIAGHIVMTMPYVILIASSRLVGFDKAMEEAAWDLGASTFTIFREITIPFLKPAIIAATLMSFTLSFDEVVVTFFTTGRDNTLPMIIWSMLRFGITPEVNAIATITVLVSGAFAVIAELSLRQAQGSRTS
ncbi:ABC transporter permease [Ferrovibrio terrae]|uniref:ABC transporter permease n=1 Tax=Ferrovibrio terrae TaxID=2594003 RepID=UPI0031382C3C